MELSIYFYDFLTLALAHFVALISPGVDFFIIIANTSKYGKLSGILTAFGISLANLIYILLALFGITLIKDNELIFISIKIIGALYLIYIAYMLIGANRRDLFEKNDIICLNSKKELLGHFLQGFLSAILNPKNSIFYFTMFSISIQSNTPNEIQSLYALWMFLAVLFWDIFIVYLVSHKKAKNFMQKYLNPIEKVSGVILLIIASAIIYNIF